MSDRKLARNSAIAVFTARRAMHYSFLERWTVCSTLVYMTGKGPFTLSAARTRADARVDRRVSEPHLV